AIEILEGRGVGLRAGVGGDQPGDRDDADRDEQTLGGADGDAVPREDEKHDRDDEGADHGDDLAPGVDAPPEPAQQVEQAGAGADLQDQVEAALRGLEEEDEGGGEDEEEDGGDAPGEDVVALGGVVADEAAVEIVDEVRSAPVEMGEDRGGVR